VSCAYSQAALPTDQATTSEPLRLLTAGPGPPGIPARHQAAVPGSGQALPGREDPKPGPAPVRPSRKARQVRLCPECRQPSVDKPTMPGGLGAWHANCWELARLERAPVLAAARRHTEAVSELSGYLLAIRRDPDLPRLSLDGLVPMGSAILDRLKPSLVAADNRG
jgi:hypothetical protein